MRLETFNKLERLFEKYNTDEKLLIYLSENCLNFEELRRIYDLFQIYNNKEEWKYIKLTKSIDTIKIENIRNINEIVNDIEREKDKTIALYLANKDYEDINILNNYPYINIVCDKQVMTINDFIIMRENTRKHIKIKK